MKNILTKISSLFQELYRSFKRDRLIITVNEQTKEPEFKIVMSNDVDTWVRKCGAFLPPATAESLVVWLIEKDPITARALYHSSTKFLEEYRAAAQKEIEKQPPQQQQQEQPYNPEEQVQPILWNLDGGFPTQGTPMRIYKNEETTE